MTVFEVMDRIAVASREPSSANTILPGWGQRLSARLPAVSRQWPDQPSLCGRYFATPAVPCHRLVDINFHSKNKKRIFSYHGQLTFSTAFRLANFHS